VSCGLLLRHRGVVMNPRNIAVHDVRLEVLDWGTGEPVVFIQTALMADELGPVATDPALDDYRKVVYHRRGYAGSSPVDGPGSIPRDAADCAALLAELDIDRAHVVGLSFSSAIALQLASDCPERARSLTDPRAAPGSPRSTSSSSNGSRTSRTPSSTAPIIRSLSPTPDPSLTSSAPPWGATRRRPPTAFNDLVRSWPPSVSTGRTPLWRRRLRPSRRASRPSTAVTRLLE
jgi:pimeloyl-ACP methyl ester carboxylesterase